MRSQSASSARAVPADEWISGSNPAVFSNDLDGGEPISPAEQERLIKSVDAVDQRSLERAVRCRCCGAEVDAFDTTLIKRGALTIERDIFCVAWRGTQIALSPTETHLLAAIAVRGFASYRAITGVLRELGLSSRSRDVLLHRVRKKFKAAGVPSPFVRCGNAGVRLTVLPDENGSSETVIGLRNVAKIVGTA